VSRFGFGSNIREPLPQFRCSELLRAKAALRPAMRAISKLHLRNTVAKFALCALGDVDQKWTAPTF